MQFYDLPTYLLLGGVKKTTITRDLIGQLLTNVYKIDFPPCVSVHFPPSLTQARAMPRRNGCICTRFCTGVHNTPTDPKRFWEFCNNGLEAQTGAEYVKNRKCVASLGTLLGCEPSFLDTLKLFPFNGRTALRAFNKNKMVLELLSGKSLLT